MKKIFLALVIILYLVFPITSFGADTIVELEWQKSPSSDVIGYNVYRSEISGSGFTKVNSAVIEETTYKDIISGDIEVTFYYVVTATDGPNESAFSNEAFIRIDTIAPEVVPGLVIKSVTMGGNK